MLRFAPKQSLPRLPAPTKTAQRKGGRGRLILGVIALGVVSAAAYYGHEWWTTGRFMVSTDDAYIGGDINYVAPKVGGYVKTSTSRPMITSRRRSARHAR